MVLHVLIHPNPDIVLGYDFAHFAMSCPKIAMRYDFARFDMSLPEIALSSAISIQNLEGVLYNQDRH